MINEKKITEKAEERTNRSPRKDSQDVCPSDDLKKTKLVYQKKVTILPTC